jgi:hypothetical protein
MQEIAHVGHTSHAQRMQQHAVTRTTHCGSLVAAILNATGCNTVEICDRDRFVVYELGASVNVKRASVLSVHVLPFLECESTCAAYVTICPVYIITCAVYVIRRAFCVCAFCVCAFYVITCAFNVILFYRLVHLVSNSHVSFGDRVTCVIFWVEAASARMRALNPRWIREF